MTALTARAALADRAAEQVLDIEQRIAKLQEELAALHAELSPARVRYIRASRAYHEARAAEGLPPQATT